METVPQESRAKLDVETCTKFRLLPGEGNGFHGYRIRYPWKLAPRFTVETMLQQVPVETYLHRRGLQRKVSTGTCWSASGGVVGVGDWRPASLKGTRGNGKKVVKRFPRGPKGHPWKR